MGPSPFAIPEVPLGLEALPAVGVIPVEEPRLHSLEVVLPFACLLHAEGMPPVVTDAARVVDRRSESGAGFGLRYTGVPERLAVLVQVESTELLLRAGRSERHRSAEDNACRVQRI